MRQMYNPAHPGSVLREWLEEMQVSDAAAKLHVSRVTLSRILNGKAGISAEMSLRLSEALGTSPTLWIDLQTQYDLATTERRLGGERDPRRQRQGRRGEHDERGPAGGERLAGGGGAGGGGDRRATDH